MTLVSDIISLALTDSGVLGVGQTALAQDTSDALTRLNMMIAQWARKRWLVWSLIDVSKVSTGAVSYTVGASQDFNTPRPDRLEAAFLRQLNSGNGLPVDYPLEVLQAREDYNRIALKTMGTFPSVIFYDAAFPFGSVYPWPVPASGLYEIHLTLKAPLTQFASTSDTVSLPPEYQAALHYNLCQRLRVAYQMPADPELNALARDSLNLIRNANTQVPRLQLPGGLTRGGSGYNVYSDQ